MDPRHHAKQNNDRAGNVVADDALQQRKDGAQAADAVEQQGDAARPQAAVEQAVMNVATIAGEDGLSAQEAADDRK